MNRAGASGSSFLFGVDFELTRGFFIESPLEQQNILFDVRGVSNVERAKINGEQKALVKNMMKVLHIMIVFQKESKLFYRNIKIEL